MYETAVANSRLEYKKMGLFSDYTLLYMQVYTFICIYYGRFQLEVESHRKST